MRVLSQLEYLFIVRAKREILC